MGREERVIAPERILTEVEAQGLGYFFASFAAISAT